MASDHNCYRLILVLFIITLSFSNMIEVSLAARHLQQTPPPLPIQLPRLPGVPINMPQQPGFPWPTTPGANTQQPQLPPLPPTTTMPLVPGAGATAGGGIPSIVTMPPLPNVVPSVPNTPTTFPPISFQSPPLPPSQN